MEKSYSQPSFPERLQTLRKYWGFCLCNLISICISFLKVYDFSPWLYSSMKIMVTFSTGQILKFYFILTSGVFYQASDTLIKWKFTRSTSNICLHLWINYSVWPRLFYAINSCCFIFWVFMQILQTHMATERSSELVIFLENCHV